MQRSYNGLILNRAAVGWLLLVLAFMLAYLNRYALASIGTILMNDFAIGASSLGLLFASYSVAYSLAIVPSGLLVDEFGPRRVAIVGLLLGGIGGLLFSQSPRFEVALVGRFLMSLGFAVVFPTIMKAQRLWFSPRVLATLTGFAVGAGNLASLVSLTTVGIAVSAWGWHIALGLLSAASFAIALLVRLVVRDEMGFAQSNAVFPPARIRRSNRFQGYLAQLIEVLQRGRSWTLFLAALGIYGSLTALVGVWGVPYLQALYGLDPLAGASYLQLLMLGATLGGPSLGWVSDRFHRRRILYSLGTGIIVISWAWLIVGILPLLVLPILFFILGLAQGVSTLGVTLINEVQPSHLAGLASSVFTIGAQIGGALIPAAMGFVLEFQGLNLHGFQTAFLFGLGGGLLSLFMTFLMPETQSVTGEMRSEPL